MKKLLIAGAFVLAATSAALAQDYYAPAPYGGSFGVYADPGVGIYDYAPGYYGGDYGYVPYGYGGGYWSDPSGNSYRQPNPHSTIRAVR